MRGELENISQKIKKERGQFLTLILDSMVGIFSSLKGDVY